VQRGDVLVEIDAAPEQLQMRQENIHAQGLELEVTRLRSQETAEQSARAEEQRTAQLSLEEANGRVREAEAASKYADAELSREQKMKEAGVDSLPGGGAEIFADRVRHIICDHKIDGDQWLDTARLAHQIGLKSNATMLYGHIENDEDRVDHLLKLRALQDETGGFQTFIPLAFHPANTPLQHLFTTTGMLDIKQIAVSRLVLDNFPHIKSYWQMMTDKIAQISLRFGADDMDGTVIEEKIYHDAGATTPQGMRREELERLIRAAGREPIERDTLYRSVRRTETSVTVAV